MKASQTLVTITAMALLSLAGVASAHEAKTEGYVIDSRGHVLRNNFKECVRTGFWTPAMAIPECDSNLAPKPAAVAAPPAPVAAPVMVKEEPKPTLVQEPIPETWKILLENKPVCIGGTEFEFDSAKLRREEIKKLDEVASFAEKYKDTQLEASGHTCSIGTEAYNQKLSERRAESVKAYLVKKGVVADRINTVGYGESKPIGDNKTREGREMNRRVEVCTVLKVERKVRVTK